MATAADQQEIRRDRARVETEALEAQVVHLRKEISRLLPTFNQLREAGGLPPVDVPMETTG